MARRGVLIVNFTRSLGSRLGEGWVGHGWALYLDAEKEADKVAVLEGRERVIPKLQKFFHLGEASFRLLQYQAAAYPMAICDLVLVMHDCKRAVFA